VVEENGTPNASTLRGNTKFSLCFSNFAQVIFKWSQNPDKKELKIEPELIWKWLAIASV
jgi:hypothetical protein